MTTRTNRTTGLGGYEGTRVGGMRIARYPPADWTGSNSCRLLMYKRMVVVVVVVVVVALPFVPPLAVSSPLPIVG
jgi:hypothetical protein